VTATFDVGRSAGRLRLWELPAGREILNLHGHAQPLMCAAFSPDGRRLATCGYDQTVIIWDLTTGRELLTYRGGPSLLAACLDFSPDGRHLAAGANGIVRIWDTPPPE
jgi:WD40 repeat protein